MATLVVSVPPRPRLRAGGTAPGAGAASHSGYSFALSPDGLVSMDSEGQIRFANPAFARLLGLEAPALLGRSEAWLDAQLRAASVQAEQLPPLARVLDDTAQAADAPASLADWLALLTFFTGWIGYVRFAKARAARRPAQRWPWPPGTGWACVHAPRGRWRPAPAWPSSWAWRPATRLPRSRRVAGGRCRRIGSGR